MKIATWNVNSLNVRLPQVLAWLQQEQPDCLALQETKVVDELFPAAALAEVGYQSVYTGQKTYNGVALLTRSPCLDLETQLPGEESGQARFIAGTLGNLRMINVYVPNGESTTSEKYLFKLNWLTRLEAYLAEALKKFPQLIVLGDFNIAPQPQDVHNPEAWVGHVLFSEPERAHFQNLLNLGLHDSFRLFSQPEKSYSWWDYRMMSFRRNHGLRIDHLLISTPLKPACRQVTIDKAARGVERPSDHAPVILDLTDANHST